MDNTKIYKIIAKDLHFKLYDDPKGGIQWLSDGIAAYAMHGMPEMDEHTALPLLGIDDNTSAKYFPIRMALPLCKEIYSDDNFGLGTVEPAQIVVQDMLMMRGVGTNAPECLFVDAKRMKPFLDDSENSYLWRPDNTSMGIIIVKRGLITVGCIIPCSPSNVSDTYISDLWKAYEYIKAEKSKAEAKDHHEDAKQLNFDDPDDEE